MINDLNDVKIKKLEENEQIPYELLFDADPSMELIERYIKTSDVFIARVQNKIIGVYVLCPVNLDQVEIKNIAVRDTYQGKGVGKLLLADASAQSSAKGYKELIIGTGNSSVGQLYLYQKSGFEIFEIKWNFFIDNYSQPLFENGIQVKHMIMLSKKI